MPTALDNGQRSPRKLLAEAVERAMVKLFSQFRRRRRPSDTKLTTALLAESSSFLIVIDGWSKKARYIERHAAYEQARRRQQAIDADPTMDIAFIVGTTEEGLKQFGTDALYRAHLKAKALSESLDDPPSAA